MFNRQFGLVAIATLLLLSASLVQAREVDGDTDLDVGNVRIQTTPSDTVIQTPQIQIVAPKVPQNKVTGGRTRRRDRKYNRTSGSVTSRKPPNSHRPGISQSEPIRSSTIRSSTGDDDSRSTIEQHQSVQCGGSGSSVSQSSTSTVNGRTIHSEVHRDCR